GPDGKGVTAEKCSTCHQDHNLEGLHLPPGAPNWHLPPRDMPMIWQGLADHGICEQLKDPARNGHRSIDQIVEHFTTDKLVAWGWNPGPGRAAVPMSREDFSAKVKEWASKGAACPAEQGEDFGKRRPKQIGARFISPGRLIGPPLSWGRRAQRTESAGD